MIRTHAAVLDAQEDPVANNSDPQLHLPNDSIRDMVTVLKLLSEHLDDAEADAVKVIDTASPDAQGAGTTCSLGACAGASPKLSW